MTVLKLLAMADILLGVAGDMAHNDHKFILDLQIKLVKDKLYLVAESERLQKEKDTIISRTMLTGYKETALKECNILKRMLSTYIYAVRDEIEKPLDCNTLH